MIWFDIHHLALYFKKIHPPPAYSFNPVKNPGHILIDTLFLLSGFGVFAQSRESSKVWK